MFEKLKQFKDLKNLGPEADKKAMQQKLNEICDAIHTILKEKQCTIQEALLAFQAIQNGLNAKMSQRKVDEV